MPKILKAYTTIEVILVLGIMILVTGMVIPVSYRQTKVNELSVSGRDLHSAIFVQQQNAFSGKNNSKHGIYIDYQGYWLFEGEDFASSTKKDYFSFGKGIASLSVNTEIIFEKSSQIPSNAESLILTYAGYNYIITINKEGVIDSYVL